MSVATWANIVRPWYAIEADEAARLLETSPAGLSPEEAARRLAVFGPNVIEREELDPWWRILVRQFTDPLIYILLIAAALTLLLRDFSDTGVILVAVALNAIIGYTQERRAQQAMRALASLSAPRCEVVRGGRVVEIPSRDVVPGDVVVLTSGTRVPADARLFRVQDLHVDESAFTGESIPVRKSAATIERDGVVPGDQLDMVFSGTIVTRGRGWGYVVRTGARTELGQIATAIRRVGETAAPLQEKMARFGKQVGVAIVLLAVAIGAIGLVRGMGPEEMLLVVIALIVSAIPESLPVVLTVTFAVGVRRMSRRNALVRALPAVETLGSATVIGSDKTGTLTQNEMTVERIWADGRSYRVTGVGYRSDGEIVPDDAGGADAPRPAGVAWPGGAVGSGAAGTGGVAPGDAPDAPRAGGDGTLDEPLRVTLLAGVLANEADPGFLAGGEPVGDPTELALHAAAAKGGIDVLAARSGHAQLDILPFEPERRFMATLNDTPAGTRIFLKGAPEVVLARCDRQLSAEGEAPLDVEAVREAAAAMAREGLRVLAMAYRPEHAVEIHPDALGGGFVFAGLEGMRDPVRPEALEAVRDAHSAGIRVVMLTGDHVGTAAAIGAELGLDPQGHGAIEGHVLNELSDEELDDIVRRVDIYARVAPEHKLRIVEALKRQGHVVAVTGDGVNDAPALRAAHLGIAMGRSGTDVAREASDIVLADDNFATITAAIEEGRVVFSNIRKVIFFLLSTTAGDILSILIALILGWPVPFTAGQILWVNLVTNGLQDMALAFEPPERGLLRRRPRPREEGVVTLRVLERFFVVGIFLAAGTLGMFYWAWRTTGDVDFARTAAMTQIVVFNFFHVFNCRSLDESLLRIPLFSNTFLFVCVVAAACAQLLVLHVPVFQAVFHTQPLPPGYLLVMLLIGTTVIFGGEFDKWRNRRRGTPIG